MPKKILLINQMGQVDWGALDRLCNGLLGEVLFRKKIRKEEFRFDDLCIVSPKYADFSYIMIWSGKGAFPWRRLEALPINNAELYFHGKLSKQEKTKAADFFTDIKELSPTALA